MASDGQTPSVNSIPIGNSISIWEGLDPVSPYLHLTAPPVDPNDPSSPPNQSKYPSVVGTDRLAVTDTAKNIRHRSWMGWFLWGDGTPPPGISAGYPATEASPPVYSDDNWDYFSWQYSAGYPIYDSDNNKGHWQPVRLDQQPLYLNPWRVNYNWPAGKFGYQTQPLTPFPGNVGFWSAKKIVRGPNLSLAYPYMVEYADYVDTTKSPNYPDEWRNSWLYVRTRPIETLVMVPGIKTPDELLTEGTWNQVGEGHQPFPYPVWDETLAPADQTPFCLKVDRMGDWDADLIWEGTHANAPNYAQNKYQPTAFGEPGQGNYLKMTVAQGSPLVWCETNHSRYVNFYNLIRTNEPGHIDNTGGTRPSDAGMATDPTTHQGVWDVPRVTGVQYVLLYGNQTNPNQFYHEVEPFKWDEQTGKPGGWNPPGAQSNHTYIAVYFKKDTVVPVDLSLHSGSDGDGNPYFYLEFTNPAQKNWYVVGAVPVMRYYHSEVAEDDAATRLAAARGWAEAMGGYAFNFLTGTQVSFEVTNMHRATTTYQTTVANPFGAAGQGLTCDPAKTVIALMPHHHQPLTLGPDLTRSDDPTVNQVVWQPLRTTGADLPVGDIVLPNANRSDPDSPSYWGYWSPRGNLKTLASDRFVTEFLFQNFLPITPPPNWEREYTQTSIQGVRVVGLGSGYEKLPTDVDAPAEGALPKATIVSPSGGMEAQLKVILEPHTDRIQQIDVAYGGSGYPDGNPPTDVTVQIDAPDPRVPGGRTATARAQVGGGKVLAIFMNDHGAGYRSTIEISGPTDQATDPAIVLPQFSGDGKSLVPGLANVVVGGAGWLDADGSAPVTATVRGTGTQATAEVIKPTQILAISGIGGFTDRGTYPSSGDLATDASAITVHVPPPAPGAIAQTMRVVSVTPNHTYFKTLIIDVGAGYSLIDADHVQCVRDDNSSVIPLTNILPGDPGTIKLADPNLDGVAFDRPIAVTFKVVAGGIAPKREAKAMIYSGYSIDTIELTGPTVSGYDGDIEIAFSGGDQLPPGLVMPEFTYRLGNGGSLYATVKSEGSGFTQAGWFDLMGGKGFNAAFRPVLTQGDRGTLVAVKVLRSGSNYPSDIQAYTNPGNLPLAVTVVDGRVVGIDLKPEIDYSGFTTIPSIFLMDATGEIGKNDFNSHPPKGAIARIHFIVKTNGGIFIDRNYDEPGRGYISLSPTATVDSLPLVLRYGDIGQIVAANQAAGFIATVAQPTLKVEQVLYDSLITRFSTLGSNNLKPFGGGFGGNSGPDGYGLGNALSSVSKVLGVLYHLRQHYASQGLDVPQTRASLFAMEQTDNTGGKFEAPIYVQHNPLISLKGSLQTMTQALQRTLSLFFQQQPYTNNPASDTWQMAYFAQYDPAGRVVINPTATIPVYGVVSSTLNPPAILDTENAAKQGLNRWTPGMLWSGFGVSDQWNDQHYFYGYYLSTAAQLALLDGSWADAKPDHLWADPDQIGTAIDQWMKTLAYDPALEEQYYDFNGVCQTNQITYGKYSFFDQWNGHPWATGVSPGRAGDVEDGRQRGPTPWSIWSAGGTGNFPYDDENENSTWEGLQAYSAIIMWGAGTNRKAIVDQGIYMLTTGNAASDLYFLDKNYNLKRGSQNRYTWCPVTTGTPASQKGGGNTYPPNTGYVDSSPEAFYGEASAGCSILQKGSPSLNNFFYAFPTGSKFIQAYPPTPWTLGMTRNLSYMQQWAGVLTRPEWEDARDSALYQAGNWLGMAMTSALCGLPYNPGDDPTKAQPYGDRLWSSWNVLGQEPGSQATMQPAEQPTSVLTFFHVMAEYGPPDWSVYAQAVNADGSPADSDIVFTAAFTKVSDLNAALVVTAYVAFNPGWATSYVSFYRLASDGTLATAPLEILGTPAPLAVPPKKMVVATQIVVRGGQTITVPSPQIGSVAVLADGTLVGVAAAEPLVGQLCQKHGPNDPWLLTAADLITPIAVSAIAALPVALPPYPPNTLVGVCNGDLYTRLSTADPWVALPVATDKVVAICFGSDGTLYGTTDRGQLLRRSLSAAQWTSVAAASTPMQSIALLPDNTTLLGVGRDSYNNGALFQKTALDAAWSQSAAVRFNSLAQLAVHYATGELVVAHKPDASPLAQDVDNSGLKQLTQVVVKQASAPTAQILANTNPNFYRTDESETDPNLWAIYKTRRVIFSASTQPLYLGQDELSSLMEFVPHDSHLTVCALNLVLAGDITIPQGDVRLYCQTLTVAAGLAVTLDVSGPALTTPYDKGPLAAPPQTGGNGTSGISGAQNNNNQGTKYGTPGGKGGSITLVCSQISLNDTLTLKADGGVGYPGADGQDASPVGTPGTDGYKVQTITANAGTGVAPSYDPSGGGFYPVSPTPTAGGPAPAGGAALAGGNGGNGGTISCSYPSKSDVTNLKVSVQGGAGGATGQPGKNGIQGIGGKTYQRVIQNVGFSSTTTDTLESQLDRTDSAPTPPASYGPAAAPSQPGSDGTTTPTTITITRTVANITALLGKVMDDRFLLMVLQLIKYRYLNCNPQQFALPGDPNTSPTYLFTPGNQTEWESIGSLITWLSAVLVNYQSKPTDGNLVSLRKYYIQYEAGTCAIRHGGYKTYFNDLANWVPRQSFDSIKQEFDANVSVLTTLETTFLQLAKSYTDSTQKALTQADYENQLMTSQAYHQAAYNTAIAQLSAARDAVETAQTNLTTALGNLNSQMSQLETAIGQNFQCRLDVIIQGLQMMAFASGGEGSMAGQMAGAVVADFVNEGLNNLKEADGRIVDKQYVIQQLVGLGSDLQTGFANQVLNNGELRYDDTTTARFMADLSQLDDQLDDLSTALDTGGVKGAVQAFRNALSERSDAILTYNAVIQTSLQYLQAYNDDTAKLAAVQNQPVFDQHDMDVFSYYTQQYQEQVDNVLRLLYLAQRKAAFLAPSLGTKLPDYWKNWTQLWTQNATPNRPTDANTINNELVTLQNSIKDQFATSSSAYSPFPANEGNTGAIQLSDLVVSLSEDLLQTLKTNHKVRFTTIPKSLPALQASRFVSPIWVSNSPNYYHVLISHVRPYLVGATTASGQVRIEITNNGMSLLDESTSSTTAKPYKYAHSPTSTNFIHTTLVAFPEGSVYTPPQTDGGGELSDSDLDLLGLFGYWTLSVSAPSPDDPLDTNHNLDLSGLSEVRIYFRGFHRSR